LAAEAFDDTTFVPSIARRIAEWRRGGATLTVVLARLDAIGGDIADPDAQAERLSVRLALQLARACVREMDLVTRWQGGGLAFLLPGTSASEAKLFARRLTTAFDSANSTMTSTRLSSICMGIAEGIEGNDAKRVLERAWLALETARSSGPASVCIHDGVRTVVAKPPAAARC
jgi:GGDEF domain-containing protein